LVADSVAPPHSPATIKRCISRVEKSPALADADLFVDLSSDAPLEENHISILSTDGPGLSPNEPMAIVQMPIVQMENASLPDGRYLIKGRAANIFWNTMFSPISSIYFWNTTFTIANLKNSIYMQVSEQSPIVQKITFLRSGTSHMILMVTSS
jgi:hypothetical protein